MYLDLNYEISAFSGWVNVDPLNVRVLGPPFGLPHVGIGTMWNFFGWGYSGDTNWVAKPGSFFSRSEFPYTREFKTTF